MMILRTEQDMIRQAWCVGFDGRVIRGVHMVDIERIPGVTVVVLTHFS